MASGRGNSRRPRVLQWNANSLRRRQAELCLHLLQEDYDVLALQEVYVTAGALRLPGYVGHLSTTSCTLDTCTEAPCRAAGHVQGAARCAVYVRASIPHAVVPVDDLAGGAMECCAVTVRIGSCDTTVASVYIRPRLAWDASSFLPLASRLGKDFLLCGDMNAHHTAWGGKRCCTRGRAIADISLRAGLLILNTGEATYVRRGVRTAIDLSLATERCAYTWTVCPDTWGSDHFPVILCHDTGRAPPEQGLLHGELGPLQETLRRRSCGWRFLQPHKEQCHGRHRSVTSAVRTSRS